MDSVKTWKTHQNAPTRTHAKNQTLLYKFLDEYYLYSIPSQSHQLFWRGVEFSKKLGTGGNFLKKSLGETKRRKTEEMQRS